MKILRSLYRLGIVDMKVEIVEADPCNGFRCYKVGRRRLVALGVPMPWGWFL